MNAVERLRAAEARLREVADRVDGGGWFTDDVSGLAHAIDGGLPLMTSREAELHADYIALMSPSVALAVADWLADTVHMAAEDEIGCVSIHYVARLSPAQGKAPLAVADAILGPEATS